MKRSYVRSLFLVVLFGLLSIGSTTFLRAQETRATVSGRVEDPSGAAIPGAKVTITNTATGVVTTGTVADDGNYTIPFLIPGTYVLKADAPNFKTAQQTNVALHVDDKLNLTCRRMRT